MDTQITTGTIEKIRGCLSDKPKTPTRITQESKSNYFSVLTALEFLVSYGVAEKITNGRTKFFLLKDGNTNSI